MFHNVRPSLPLILAAVCITMLTGPTGATTNKKQSMNSILLITPYKHHGSWVFDDPAVGLVREPFIAGIDTMIDQLVANIPDAERGFRAFFSATPFPGYEVKLTWRRTDSGGNWYFAEKFGSEGWLCPALYKYFEKAPSEIFVKAEPLKR
jgi:hypothetical protein